MDKKSFNGLSMLTDEIKQELQKRDEMVNNEDTESLFLLNDNSDFSIALHEILVSRYDKNPNALNPEQLNLFLCMHLENAIQSASILTFLQEWFPEQKKPNNKIIK